MNNYCPIESKVVSNSALSYDEGDKNWIWPSSPADANKYIVPPAIETDYSYTITLNIKGGHSIVKGPYIYKVECGSNQGITGSIGDNS